MSKPLQGPDAGIMITELPLRQLSLNQKAKVTTVAAHGEMGRRIRDMGLIPGAEIQVVGRAPLQDPVALRLKGFTLSLRNSEADFIRVILTEEPAKKPDEQA